MKRLFFNPMTVLICAALLLLPAAGSAVPPEGKGPPNGGEEAGNNLSYPVIWAEGVEKVLPGTPEMAPILLGEWWYSWGTTGTDPDVTPLSCPPDPDNVEYCDDGIPGSVTGDLPGAGGNMELVRAYLQKDPLNLWQAQSGTPFAMGLVAAEGDSLIVHWIDWGDNLESVDWYTKSQVRTEVVLFQDNPDPLLPWLEYEMRHTSGWGITEVHGLAADVETQAAYLGSGLRGTVYSHCARLTIQKLLVDRDDPALAALVWVPGEGWTGDGLINPHIFNGSVHEGGDGPGYYSAEINVKGRIIYGYTWNVRKLNEGAGDYRLTFSFDETCGTVDLNTFFVEGTTQLLLPVEEIVTEAEEEPGGGAIPVLDFVNNLTFIDVRILERGGGGGGGGGNGGKPGGGGGGGGGGRPPGIGGGP